MSPKDVPLWYDTCACINTILIHCTEWLDLAAYSDHVLPSGGGKLRIFRIFCSFIKL